MQLYALLHFSDNHFRGHTLGCRKLRLASIRNTIAQFIVGSKLITLNGQWFACGRILQLVFVTAAILAISAGNHLLTGNVCCLITSWDKRKKGENKTKSVCEAPTDNSSLYHLRSWNKNVESVSKSFDFKPSTLPITSSFFSLYRSKTPSRRLLCYFDSRLGQDIFTW